MTASPEIAVARYVVLCVALGLLSYAISRLVIAILIERQNQAFIAWCYTLEDPAAPYIGPMQEEARRITGEAAERKKDNDA